MTNDPDSRKVLYVTDGPVATITINRPEARNAVDGEVARSLREAVDRLEADDAVRVGVLTGAGSAFCAGMDLRAFAAGETRGIVQPTGGFAGFVRHPRRKPVIGAINGPALAGGCEVALACDFLVASTEATFGLPEPTRGLVAAAGGAFRLARSIPYRRAVELLLTAEGIDAREAHRLGLVNHVVEPDELLAFATTVALGIAANAPRAVEAGLEIARLAFDLDDRALWDLTGELAARVNTGQDAREGAQAFVERRAPVWKGE